MFTKEYFSCFRQEENDNTNEDVLYDFYGSEEYKLTLKSFSENTLTVNIAPFVIYPEDMQDYFEQSINSIQKEVNKNNIRSSCSRDDKNRPK